MEKRKRVVACIILLCIMFVGGIFVYNHLQDNSTIDIQTTIDYKVFKNPLQSSKTRPLWFWNDDVSEMSEDKVREIVEKSYKQSGYDGMAILPNWIDGYLTDEYFELYEAALDEGQKHGMHFTLYDENGFPSSNAGGILAQKYPDLTSKRLDKYEQDTSESEPVTIDLPIGTCMGAVAMNLETFERLNITDTVIENSDGSYRLKYTPESGNWKIMAFMCVLDGNNSMDYLDEKSVSAFIDITYEAYYDRFKKYFDNGTITGAFYDEPTFWPWGDETSSYGVEGGRVWTSDYNTEYEKRYGNNPTLDYPALWYSIGEDTQEARDKLFGVRTNLFADNYIGQMNQWCDEHRIELTGHMLLEEWRNPVGLDGDLMKVFKNQDIPGVDVIGGFGNAQEAYKIISSSAYNWDKDKIMAESFGGMGTNVPISTLYKTTMDLYAKGINDIVPHAIWYNTTPEKVEAPPELSYRNSKYSDELKAFNNYVGRLNTLLQGGRHIADIAVLYPIDYLESEFVFNGEINAPEDSDYMDVGEFLSLEERKDFTYLHPDILNERCEVADSKLRMNNENNNEEYKIIIIPGMEVIDLNNLRKIKEFYDGGGIVIGTTQLPYLGINAEDNETVVALVKEMFGVDPQNEMVANSIEPNNEKGYSENTNDQGGKAFFTGVTYKKGIEKIIDEQSVNYDVDFIETAPIENGHLTYIHKVKDDKDIYYFANSGDQPVKTTINIGHEIKNPEIWNPASGKKEKCYYSLIEKNGEMVSQITLNLEETQSLFLLTDK